MEKINHLSKENFLEELWHQFIQKINSDWVKKYAVYGKSLNEIQKPTKFAQAVYSEMVAYFEKNSLNITMVNYLTLHSYFQSGQLKKSAKIGTLDILSLYLGYSNWKDFKEKNRNNILKKINKDIKPEQLGLIISSKKRYFKWASVFLLLTISILTTYLCFLYMNQLYFNKQDKIEIEKVIREANALEFHLRKAVPNLNDTVKLDNYFTDDATAKQILIGSLKKSIRENRRLRHSSSVYAILDIKIKKKLWMKPMLRQRNNGDYYGMML